jgi:MSHA biogenesis protein MshM
MYLQHFGLTGCPLDKGTTALFDDGQLAVLKERFNWLLESPGIGLLTADSGVGKTAALRQLTTALNPHRYQVIYTEDTHCSRRDLYTTLALNLSLEPAWRCTQLWRDIKARVLDLADNKQVQIIWIIDEAQNLPGDFYQDFPAFLNFAFDSRELMTIWLLGSSKLLHMINRVNNTALTSRFQVRVHLHPVVEPERFRALIEHGFKAVGCQQTLISDSGFEMLRQASGGRPRQASQIIKVSLRLAASKGLNHLPDELIEEAVEILR